MTIYVSHTCFDAKCFKGFNAPDITRVKDRPPSWKYCPDCVASGKPDYQKPKDNPAIKLRLQKAEAKGFNKHRFTTRLESPTSDLNS